MSARSVAVVAVLALLCGSADAKKKPKPKPKKKAAVASVEKKPAGSVKRLTSYDGAAPVHGSGGDADTFVLNAVGDIAYPNGWGGVDHVDAMKEHMFDFVRPWFDTGDLTFANIECPLTYRETKVKKTYPITCKPERLGYLLDAGFNLFSLANNHALDAGTDGLEDTIAHMEVANRADRPVFWAGIGRSADEARAPIIFTVPGKNVTVALFAISSSGAGPVAGYDKDLPARIAEAKTKVDVVLVSVHAGAEYVHEANAGQAARYRSWIDAGAAAVLGHHAHVVQGVERYKDGLILYNMGNFSFGSRTKRHKETGARMYSMIARLTFKKGKLVDARIVPLWASNTEALVVGADKVAPDHCTPQVLTGVFAAHAIGEFQDFSAAVPDNQTKIDVVDDLGVVDLGLPAEELVVVKKRRLPRVLW